MKKNIYLFIHYNLSKSHDHSHVKLKLRLLLFTNIELETDVDMSELANLPPVSVSFEVKLPDEIDEEEVVTLLQVLQEDVEGFDEMLQAVQSIDKHEQLNQREPQTDQNLQVSAQQHKPEPVPAQQSEPNLHVVVPQTDQNLKVPAQHEPNLEVPDEQPINTTTLGRFKQLDADALLEIEQNQYSAATKKNTKWGIGVFNGTK